MIALRGDLASPALRGAVEAATGAPVPDRLRHGGGVAWMSPDELLLTVAPDRLDDALESLRGALAGQHALVADVSGARVAFGVEGPGARDALGKLTPVDLAPEAFGPGAWRRSRLGQVAAAIACLAPDAFEVLVARSQAVYASRLLGNAADPSAPVGFHDRGAG